MSAPFRHSLRVRYHECDPQGVVFNANYLAWFDMAITELWRPFGGYDKMADAGTDIVVAEALVRYLTPARFDEEVDLVVRGVRLGNTSITTELAVERAGEPIAEGELRHVFVDPAKGASVPMPASVREGLAPYSLDG